MKIRIREADIRNGERFSLHSCPVGLAVKRAFTGKEIRVSYGHVSTEDDREYVLYTLPKMMAQWQKDFEEGKPVTAVEFQLELARKSGEAE